MVAAGEGRSIARESIGWSIGLSVVLIVVGLLALFVPLAAGVAANILVAWLLILGGVAHLIFAWHVKGAGGHVWQALVGVVYLFVGVFMLIHPLVGLLSLTLLLGCYLLLKGIAEFVLAARMRPVGGVGWLVFDGIICVVLAGFIYWSLPFAATWLIGTYLGIAILFSGFSRLMVSMSARRLVATA